MKQKNTHESKKQEVLRVRHALNPENIMKYVLLLLKKLKLLESYTDSMRINHAGQSNMRRTSRFLHHVQYELDGSVCYEVDIVFQKKRIMDSEYSC
jgi:hypothetical protein